MLRFASAKVLLAALACFSLLGLAAAEFPPASQLPMRPEFPDPLTMLDGRTVTSKRDWLKKRAPELKQLFQHYEYGYFPPPVKTEATVDHVDKKCFGGKATLKLITIAFPQPQAPELHVLLVVPNARKGPAPVFAGLNFCGNHALITDTNVPISTGWMNSKYPGVVNNRATEASRGQLLDGWALEQSIDRGYAVATLHYGEVQPDLPDATGGLRDFFRGSTDPNHDWATIAAWAWGLQRVVDYLQTDKDLDRKRIAVVGHSRLGKTALLAAAFDERIALAIPSQAGCGGTAPSRLGPEAAGKKIETLQGINDRFPHWFCAEFKNFGPQPQRLPFDQHCLIALCAPRPVLLSNAAEDLWANPEGQFRMLQAADKVYRLMGTEGLAAQDIPEQGKLIDSTLGYYIRAGKHSMTKADWKAFLDFADKHLK